MGAAGGVLCIHAVSLQESPLLWEKLGKGGLYVCCRSRSYSRGVSDGGGTCCRDRNHRSRGYGLSDGSTHRRSVGDCGCAGRGSG